MGLRTDEVLANRLGTVATTGEMETTNDVTLLSLNVSTSARMEYGVQAMRKAPIMTAIMIVDRFSAASLRRFFCVDFTKTLVLCLISRFT